MESMKRWFKWIVLLPDDDDVDIKPVYELEKFELWAFGESNSHRWMRFERERRWNNRHGQLHIIPYGEYIHDHMKIIIKFFDEYTRSENK
jgi:hypothetical protein